MLELSWQQEATDAVGWGFEVNRLLTDACSCVCLLQCMTQEWYRNFVNEGVAESEMAFGLLEAGHYMDIRPLIELMCLRITFVEFADRSWEEVSAESTVGPHHALRVLCSHAFFSFQLQAMFNNEAPPSAAASTNEEAAAAAAPAVEAGGDN